MEREVVDCVVFLDGENPGFFAYMDAERARHIQAVGGLEHVDQVMLRETKDRQIPECLKRGEALIIDVLTRILPNQEHYLN